MKQYRLKESVKKFINAPDPDAINTLSYWLSVHVKEEALEIAGAYTKIILGNIVTRNEDNNTTLKKEYTNWTEEERRDVEKFINIFGSMEDLNTIAIEWCEYNLLTKKKEGFFKWIKEVYEEKK